jgi:hypothetical protein
MKKNKSIPTAEELAATIYQPIGMTCNEFAVKLAIEFAKLHVQAQNEAIVKKAKVKEIVEYNDQPSSSMGDDYTYVVDKKSITKAYPLSNIK